MHVPSSRRVAYWAAAVFAALLTVGGVVLATSAASGAGSGNGPAATVTGYFAALQRGDAAAALGYGPPPSGSRALLTPAVLAEQQRVAPIRGVSVRVVRRSGSRAVVHVRYLLDFAAGQRVVTSSLRLHRSGSWRLRQVAVRTRVQVASASERATLAGAAVPGSPVLLFPGAAPVRFDTPYLAVGPSGGSVAFGAPPTTVVRPVVTQAGRLAAAGAVSQALNRCVTAAQPDPACPLPTERFIPGTVHGQVLGRLSDDLHVRLRATPAGLLDIAGHAPVRVRYQRLTFRDRVVTGQERFALPVHAQAYAVAPLRIRWVGP